MKTSSWFKGLVFVKLYTLCFSACLMGQMPVTVHPQPQGYTTQQTQYKNVIQVDPNDQVWMGFRDIGLGKYDGTGWIVYDSLLQGLPSNNVLAIGFSNTGDVWAGTTYGATRFDGSSWTNFNTINSGLPENKVTAVSCGTSQVWFGTNTGIAGYDGTNWMSYSTTNSGLINDTITSILVAPGGAVWVGTLRGLSKFENNTWTTYDSLTSVIPSKQIYDLEYDNYGNIWISGYRIFVINSAGQILKFQGDLYQEEFPASTGRVDFAKDDTGRILFRVTSGGEYFFRYDNLSYESFQMPAFNQGTMALGYSLEIDSNNQFWYTSKRDAGNSSLTSFDLNSYQPLTTTNFPLNVDNYKSLDISDVKALMLNRGDMHWDISNTKYEVPKGSGKSTVFSSAMWIGGMDAGGNIHLAAHTYRQTGVDYWPGPISGISIPFDSASCEHYNKIWKISKWEVEAFKDNYANGSVTNGSYAVPKFFLSWPAKGNNFITDDKAPFFDNNNDNIYNPYDGDYPLIKGDQMLFWMFNDSLAVHSETQGPKIGLEIHASAYAYSCPGIADSNVVMNRTTLYNYRIINRSQHDYTNFFTGMFCDVGLGSATDDYVGCDTTIAAAFAYNGDNNDETSYGYGLNPPMQNVVVLKGHLADVGDGVDNDLDGIVDETGERTTMNHFHHYGGINNSPMGNPNGFLDFYRYLQSIWLDGIHVTYGGDGRDLIGIPTNFFFSGTPYDTGWTEFNEGNPAEDRRFLLSTGPVSFPAGVELTLDLAYVFTRDSINPNGLTTSVARNIADVQRVHSWFDNDNFPSCEVYSVGAADSFVGISNFNIYPNPAIDVIYLTHNYQLNSSLVYQISDISGRILRTEKFNKSSISVLEFSPGFYFLTVTDGKKNISGRFVKY